AGAVGLIMVANEIMAPIAAARDAQAQYNARLLARIRFFAELGAEPRWGMEDMDVGNWLPWRTKPSIGAVYGRWLAPRLVSINVPALLERLPGRLPDFQSLVMFLNTGKDIGVIEQEGARYF